MSNEWIDYKNDYEKIFYDIELESGKVYINCWPNAGKFHHLDSGAMIDGKFVSRFKVSDTQGY